MHLIGPKIEKAEKYYYSERIYIIIQREYILCIFSLRKGLTYGQRISGNMRILNFYT